MANRLPGSKFGEGTGGASNVTDDPNNPSYDPATHKSSTDSKIRELMSPSNVSLLTQWEVRALSEMYGADRLSRKQHILVWKIYRRVMGPPTDQPAEGA